MTYVAAPLDPELVKEVKARLANGESQSKVARDLKVSRPKVNELAREVPKPTVAASTIVRNVQEDYARDVRAAMPPAAESAAAAANVWQKISGALPKAVDCLVSLLESELTADGVKVRAAAAIAQIAKDHAEKMDDAETDNVFEFLLASRPKTMGAGDAASMSVA